MLVVICARGLVQVIVPVVADRLGGVTFCETVAVAVAVQPFCGLVTLST